MSFKDGLPFGVTKKSAKKFNDQGARKLAATAALLKERRLAVQASRKDEQDSEVEHAERNMGRTQDALGKLGAGQNYGE